jgi:autotransporter-associated beta strand protein
LNISGTSGATITTLSGIGNINLGAQQLTFSNASGIFSGVINGTGGLILNHGSQTLLGENTFSGGITVTTGNTLSINSAAALGSGTLNLVGNTTTPAILNIQNSTVINNPITISGDPTFYVAPGAIYTQAGVISNGATPGDIVISGGGTVTLTAINTYTGPTLISASSVLQLFGTGSIQYSSRLTNNGIFDISGATGPVYIQSFDGTGQFLYGSNSLTILLDKPAITTASNPSLNFGVIKTPVAPPTVAPNLGQETVTNTLTTVPSSLPVSSVANPTAVIAPSSFGPDVSQQVVNGSTNAVTPLASINLEAVQASTQIVAISFVEPSSGGSTSGSSSTTTLNNLGSINPSNSIFSGPAEPNTQVVPPSNVVTDMPPTPKLTSKPIPSDSLDQGDTSLAQVTPPLNTINDPQAESRREIRVITTPVATGVAIQKVVPIKQPVTKVFQHPISGDWSAKE